MKLAGELQQSETGQELLRALSEAATQGGAAASDLYSSLSQTLNEP